MHAAPPCSVRALDQIKTGVEGRNVAFLFTDTQIVVETMLEDLNNVLNSGEIPNLFPQDEQVGKGMPFIFNARW